jgi:hypothetical protein
MNNELPDPIDVASYLLSDLADKMPGAVERYRFLLMLDADFGTDFLMLPGGTTSSQAYAEARSCYVMANYLATVILAQGFLENLLGSHLVLQEGIRPIHGKPDRQSGSLAGRPTIREVLAKSVEDGLISNSMVPRVERLIELRNPLIHHRDANDQSRLMRRSMSDGMPESDLLEEDAKFAITLVVEIAHKAMSNMIPQQR